MAKARIMVVEDEVLVADEIRLSLEYLGYEVIAAINYGEEAVERAILDRPDLVLMDIGLAGELNGVEAAKRIHSQVAIPVVFLTGFDHQEMLDLAKEAEPSGYILKPYKIRDIQVTIEMALHKARVEAERDRAQEALRHSEETLRKMFSASPDAILVMDLSGRIIECNQATLDLYGFESRENILTWKFQDLIAPREHPRMRINKEKLLENDFIKDTEYTFLARDGREFSGEFSVGVIRDPFNRPISFIGVAKDISHRKRAERDLKEAYEGLENRAREMTALLNASKAVLEHHEFPRAAETIFQISSLAIGATSGYVAMLSDDGTQNEVLFMQSGHDRQSDVSRLSLPLRGLRAETFEQGRTVYDNQFSAGVWMQYMPPDHFPVENIMFAPLVHKADEVVGIIALANKPGGFTEDDARLATAFGEFASIALRNAKNLDALEKSQENYKQAKEIAEDANKAKSQFLANVSHEIRTPMNAIIGMTDLAMESGLNEEQYEYLEAVKSSAQYLLNLINELLDLSKIESGKQELTWEGFSIRTSLANMLRPLMVRAKDKGLRLRYRIGTSVPDSLMGDLGTIRQVVYNLITNAIKFTNEGEVSLDVELMGLKGDDVRLQFSVSDTGVGIPREKHQRIFDPFMQADASTTRKYGGTGLGLAISKQLVNLMAGELTLTSEPGKGSTFAFSIVVQKTDELDIAAGAKQESRFKVASQTGSSARALKILLAEDNPVNRKLAIRLLEKRGHSVVAVVNGQEVVDAFESQPFDLILMDVQMPVMDGLQATAVIREKEAPAGKRIPIVALTAHAMKGDRERILDAGLDAYLSKPIDKDRFYELIAQLTQSGQVE